MSKRWEMTHPVPNPMPSIGTVAGVEAFVREWRGLGGFKGRIRRVLEDQRKIQMINAANRWSNEYVNEAIASAEQVLTGLAD